VIAFNLFGHSNGDGSRQSARRSLTRLTTFATLSRRERGFAAACVLVLLLCSATTQAVVVRPVEAPADEPDYYRIIQLPIPEGVVLEAGAMDLMPDGKLAVATRRGDVYLVEKPFSDPPTDVKFHKFASGMHEVLGLAQKDGQLYCMQRGELTLLEDTDNDGRADVYKTIADGWDITGDYHEFNFGSKFDRDGNLWMTLCLTGSSSSAGKYRGWCLRFTPEGKLIPTASGIRSPGGMGMNAEGDMFYTDNQGPWNGSCALKHLAPGSFQGNPESLKWYELTDAIGPAPKMPESGSRMHIEAAKIPQLMPPPVIFPYPVMGQSASGIECDLSGGKFGPFSKQMFVADHTHATVMRVYLEKVNGRYQGACFPFRSGFGSGALSMLFAPDGSLFVGGTSRGWGSQGRDPYALERLVWTGKTPFEVHEMRAKHDGFELTFTQPVDAETAGDPDSYEIATHTYIYQKNYGSPEVDQTTPSITRAVVANDRRSVRLHIDGLQLGHVHTLQLDGVRSAEGKPVLHAQAYYTLNQIPAKE
jgi:glucose/arabinose dehydrogenase